MVEDEQTLLSGPRESVNGKQQLAEKLAWTPVALKEWSGAKATECSFGKCKCKEQLAEKLAWNPAASKEWSWMKAAEWSFVEGKKKYGRSS